MRKRPFFQKNGLNFGLKFWILWSQSSRIPESEKDQEKGDLGFFSDYMMIQRLKQDSQDGHEFFFHDFNIKNRKSTGHYNSESSCQKDGFRVQNS